MKTPPDIHACEHLKGSDVGLSLPLLSPPERSNVDAAMEDRDARLITLDVREDIREGREVFRRIMDSVSRMTDGDRLRVIAPFEPLPLIALLANRGFTSVVKTLLDGFEVTFEAPSSPDEADESLI